MPPSRLAPGERTSARLGARLGRSSGRRPRGAFLLRLVARLEPRAAAARPLLLRAAHWDGSRMLGASAVENAGIWTGVVAPDLVLPQPAAHVELPPAGALVAARGHGAPAEAAPSRAVPAPGGAAPAREGVARRRGRRGPPVRSHWARQVAAAAGDRAAPGPGRERGPAAPSAPTSSRRAPTPAMVPEARPLRGAEPPLRSFDRLQERGAHPAGVLGPVLSRSDEPAHPAVRGMAAARAAIEPGRVTPESDRTQHPARAVLAALARAGSSEQVVRTIAKRAATPAALAGLPAPLAEVVQQIRQQAERVASQRLAGAGGRIVASVGRRERERSRPDPGGALGRGGFEALAGSAQVVSLATQRLIRRLQSLVHIAEADRRVLEAQRQVRRAEDSAQARAEGSAPVGAGAAGGPPSVDLDTLGRDVMAAVNSVFQARTERRQEDPDVRNDVWW